MTGGSETDAHRDVPVAASAPHGFWDDEATRRLLRSRPPHRALAWAEAVLGFPVISARPLRGGTPSAVHRLGLRPGAAVAWAVMRRYVRPELNLEEPGIVAHEVAALARGLRTGRFIAEQALARAVADLGGAQ